MKKETIDNLFESMEGSFDVHQTPDGHEKRFLDRLNARRDSKPQQNWWKPLSIAASIVVILGLGFSMLKSPEPSGELASVSAEMEQTQTFFVLAINSEIEKLKSFETPDTKKLIDDALIQIAKLEEEYQQLKIDLVESGNDKRVIYAMISNFQNRIDLLEQVVVILEDFKNLKTNENEITI
jgi:anti-sigma-K factor RskA